MVFLELFGFVFGVLFWWAIAFLALAFGVWLARWLYRFLVIHEFPSFELHPSWHRNLLTFHLLLFLVLLTFSLSVAAFIYPLEWILK